MDEERTTLLAQALKSFIRDYTDSLARILSLCEQTGEVAYEELRNVIEPGDEIEEVLLTAWEWRLLVPRKSNRTLQWDDRLFIPGEGQVFECPLIIRKLISIASKTGKWEPLDAAAAISKEMSIEPRERVSKLVGRLIELAENGHISSLDIRRACRETGLMGREDTVISNFKAAGIISPALGYLPGIKKHRGPLYELNPSLLMPGVK